MKILILSSSAGNGHNSTAKCLKDKILKHDPNAEIKVVNSYEAYASKTKAWIMGDGYTLLCNHAISVYNHFFKQSEKSTYENRDKSKANADNNGLLYGMLKEIYTFKPDVIISTYIFCSVALRNLKRCYEIPAETICMTLDYGISPYWECCSEGLDHMFLTGDYMVKPFKEKGYTDEQIVVSGIPVAEKFSQDIDKIEARKSLNLDEKKFTLLIMKSTFFPISSKDIINFLKKIDRKIQVVIINGNDKKSKESMDKLIKKTPLNHVIHNIGFTFQMVEYLKASDLVLGKAGGLSTTECVNAGVPSIILDKLPQQEIYNKDYLINHGCALPVTKKTIATTINALLNNPKQIHELHKATLSLQKSDTLDKIYDVIKNCKKPDYSNVKMPKSKSEVIKNVNNARKKAIDNAKKINAN